MKHYLQNRNNNYDLFDAFDDFFRPVFFDETKDLKTNIRETDDAYELELALPGYDKDEIKVSLENGYLTVSAARQKSEENEKKYLRKEICESTSRSYYVGTNVTREQIKAKYADGILNLTVPKAQPQPAQTERYIAIE